MDDLYNNLKVYETEVKGTSSSSTSKQNMAFVTNILNMDKNEPERTKSEHEIGRMQEIDAEGVYILNGPNLHAGNPQQFDWILRRVLDPMAQKIRLGGGYDWKVEMEG
ncbi:hypothetical protein Tco_1398207 [Tanacetum coccineum]